MKVIPETRRAHNIWYLRFIIAWTLVRNDFPDRKYTTEKEVPKGSNKVCNLILPIFPLGSNAYNYILYMKGNCS